MYLHDSLGFMKETGPSNDTLSFKWEVKKKKKGNKATKPQ